MTTYTLKINSYTNSTTILMNGQRCSGLGITNNFRVDCSIIDRADDILHAFTDEWNETFTLSVYGNMFEQEFMRLKCATYPPCEGYDAHDISIALSTRERLKLLSKVCFLGKTPVPISIDSGGIGVSLPNYPLFEFVPSDDEHKIIVSTDRATLLNSLPYTQECAFLVGGESELVGNHIVIGCTPENVRDMVFSYIETKHINPAIGELFNCVYKDYPTNNMQCLIPQIEPYFFTKNSGKTLVLNDDGRLVLPIHSVSLDANKQVLLDDPNDLARLAVEKSNDELFSSGESPMHFVPQGHGNCDISVYFESDIAVGAFHVVVRETRYATKLSIHIEHSDGIDVGAEYPLHLTVVPENATDKDQIIIECSDKNVAEINGDYIRIKNPGEFVLTARSSKVCSKPKSYCAKLCVVNDIYVPNWPRTLEKGRTTTCGVEIVPSRAARSGYRYEILHGMRKIELRQIDGYLYIKGKRAGEATVRLTSNDNPNVFCDRRVKIKRNRQPTDLKIFGYLGLALLLVTAILMFCRSDYFWLFSGLSLASFIVACLRMEETRVAYTVIGTILLALCAFLRLYTFYPITEVASLSEIPKTTITELLTEAETAVREEEYNYSEGFANTVTYQAHAVEYLGYYYLKAASSANPHNILYYIFQVDTTDPTSLKTKRFFCAVPYTSFEWHHKLQQTELKHVSWETRGFSSFADLVDELLFEQSSENSGHYVIESHLSDEIFYDVLGMPRYLSSEDQVDDNLINNIVNCYQKKIANQQETSSDKSITYSDIKLKEVKWNFSDSYFDNNHNSLTVHLYREQFRNGELVQTFNYSVRYTNICVDKKGNVDLIVEDGKLSAK